MRVPFAVRDGWTTPALGTIAETRVPMRDKPTDLTGPIPWVRIEDFDGQFIAGSKSEQGVDELTIRAMNLKVMPTGTVLCTCSCSMGTTAIVATPLVTNQTFIGLVPDPRRLDSRFLFYALRAFKPMLDAQATGAIQQYLSRDDFRQLRIPVPSLVTQRAIADYLDAETARIDGVIGARRKQLALMDERQHSMLSKLLVPVDTPFVRLRHLAELQSGLTVDAMRDPGPDPVVRPYLRVANVQPGWLDLDSVTEIAVPRSLAERCTLRVGDVLMTEGGDLDKLGRGTIWRGELPGALHQNHVFAVRPRRDVLSPDYLALLTQTAHARAYFESTGTRTTNLASTNSEKIMSLPIPRLTLEYQRRGVADAVAHLDGIAQLKKRTESQVDLLLERRQALITAAVTGQLEIPGVAA